MSKLRRNNIYSSPGNRNKTNSNDEMKDFSKNGKMKLNKSKLMSHGEFLNRIQKSLYYDCGGNKTKMSIPLSDYIAESFTDTHNGYSLNRLNYSTIGNLRTTPCSLILAMIYLERLKDTDPAYTKHVTPTELFLVSMMVATKFYSGHDEDAPYVNWSECLNTSNELLLQMELCFLNSIDWKIYVSHEEFFEKVKSLESILARRQGTARGYFTYVELSSVMPSVQIAKQFMQSILVLGLSYTVFVATMLASVYLVSKIPGTYLNASTSSQLITSSTHSATDIASTPTQQDIKTENDTDLFSATSNENEQIESLLEATERSNIIDTILNNFDRLKTAKAKTSEWPNTTAWTSSIFSSWYSLINWPVLEQYLCDNDFVNENSICNSSLCTDLSIHSERFKFGFSGIKLKWA